MCWGSILQSSTSSTCTASFLPSEPSSQPFFAWRFSIVSWNCRWELKIQGHFWQLLCRKEEVVKAYVMKITNFPHGRTAVFWYSHRVVIHLMPVTTVSTQPIALPVELMAPSFCHAHRSKWLITIKNFSSDSNSENDRVSHSQQTCLAKTCIETMRRTPLAFFWSQDCF